MPIKSNVPNLMKQKGLNASDLMRETGTAYSTAHSLSKGKLGRSISIDLLERLCKIFNVGVGEILVYKQKEN